MTDLANRLDEWADEIDDVWGESPSAVDLRLAAARLRHLDALLTAIGDLDLISVLIARCREEAEACTQVGGFGETVNALTFAADTLARIADAATNNQQDTT